MQVKLFLPAMLLAAATLLTLPVSTYANTYSVTPLPEDGGKNTSINNSNQILLWNYIYEFEDDILTPLPDLLGRGLNINNNGDVVGIASMPDGTVHPILWQNGTVIDLGLPTGMINCQPLEVNDSLQIVISCHNSNVDSFSYLWQNNQFTNLDNFFAYAINNEGQLAGSMSVNGIPHPFLWENGVLTNLGLPDDVMECQAVAINDNGQIAGQCQTNVGENAYLWDNGQIIQILGFAGAAATNVGAINNVGEVVGETMNGTNHYAYVWKEGVSTLLPKLDEGVSATGMDINDLGWIVGTQSKTRVLWRPVTPAAITVGNITAIPAEPIPAGSSISASASFTDEDTSATHTVTWNWGDGTTSNGIVDEANDIVTGDHVYITAGVYEVSVTVADGVRSATSPVYQYVVVYNPTMTKVDGAKEFMSSLGKVDFGFHGDYVNNVLHGSASVSVGDIAFKADALDWIAVDGDTVRLQATGTIKHRQGTYRLFISATDIAAKGQSEGVDLVRVKLVNTADPTDVIFDSQPGDAETSTPTTVISKGDIDVQ